MGRWGEGWGEGEGGGGGGEGGEMGLAGMLPYSAPSASFLKNVQDLILSTFSDAMR